MQIFCKFAHSNRNIFNNKPTVMIDEILSYNKSFRAQ